jgi:hypothetical protein
MFGYIPVWTRNDFTINLVSIFVELYGMLLSFHVIHRHTLAESTKRTGGLKVGVTVSGEIEMLSGF